MARHIIERIPPNSNPPVLNSSEPKVSPCLLVSVKYHFSESQALRVIKEHFQSPEWGHCLNPTCEDRQRHQPHSQVNIFSTN